jgi:hypothetical protein
MLDLDVGFLTDPTPIIDTFLANQLADIVVQEDLIYLMNRTKIGWKTWFTEQLPNIGLFLCKGTPTTVKVFDIAWKVMNSLLQNSKLTAHLLINAYQIYSKIKNRFLSTSLTKRYP